MALGVAASTSSSSATYPRTFAANAGMVSRLCANGARAAVWRSAVVIQ